MSGQQTLDSAYPHNPPYVSQVQDNKNSFAMLAAYQIQAVYDQNMSVLPTPSHETEFYIWVESKVSITMKKTPTKTLKVSAFRLPPMPSLYTTTHASVPGEEPKFIESMF